jgi:hypothetical protein
MSASGDNLRRRFIVRWLFWCWCLAIWTVALLTTFPVKVGHEFMAPEVSFSAAKVLHVSAYAFLTVFLVLLPIPTRARWCLVAVLSVHGFGTEYLQQWVEHRTASIRDVGFDHLGILLGLAAGWKWW